jgi:hypothetical protein
MTEVLGDVLCQIRHTVFKRKQPKFNEKNALSPEKPVIIIFGRHT